MLEALRAYAQVAAGLAEPAAAKAREAARALLEAGGAAGTGGTSVPELAEELLAVARSNRELLLDVVRTEVRQSVGRLGLVDAGTAESLRRRVVTLERDVEKLRDSLTTNPAPAKKAATKKARTKRSAPESAATKKATTKKAATKRAATRTAPTKRATTKRAATTKTTTKKAASRRPASGGAAGATP